MSVKGIDRIRSLLKSYGAARRIFVWLRAAVSSLAVVARSLGRRMTLASKRLQNTLLYKKAASFYRKHPVLERVRRWFAAWAKEHPYQVTAAALVFILAFIFLSYSPAHASTAIVLPTTDVTTQWTPSTGTSHFATVDDGVTADASDYVGTGTGGSSTETDEMGLNSVANVTSASQLVLNVFAIDNTVSATQDTLQVNLRVNGVLQTAVTCSSLSASTYGWCAATFTGSWSQADVNSMRVVISNTVLGGAGKEDDIRVGDIYGSLTYVSSLSYTQASYRLFNNTDATSYRTWASAYGKSNTEQAFRATTAADGGYVAAGTQAGGAALGTGAEITRYDAYGNIQWMSLYGGQGASTDVDKALGVVQLNDGNYVMAGQTNHNDAGGVDALMVKVNSTGNMVWQIRLGGTGDDTANAITKTSDGGFAVCGQTKSYSDTTNGDAFLAKYDSTGTLGWFVQWGSTGADTCNGLAQTSDGGYAMLGATTSYGDTTSGDQFLAKYDSVGTLSWSRTWGGTAGETTEAVAQLTGGDIVTTGFTSSFSASADMYTTRYTATGTFVSNTVWGTSGAGSDSGWGIRATNDGGYVVAGQTATYGKGNNDGFIAKYDSSDNLSWSSTLGGANSDFYRDVLVAKDGAYVAIGSTLTFGSGSNDILVAKYDASGNINGCTSGTNCTSPSVALSNPSATQTSPSVTPPVNTPGTGTPSTPEFDVAGAVGTTIAALNNPTIDVGSALASQDTPATIPSDGQPFRLRINVSVGSGNLAASGEYFKLQYAARSGTCDSAFSGETYNDVTTSSTVRFYDNPNALNAMGVSTNTNDPDYASTPVRESYAEGSSTLYSDITAMNNGQSGGLSNTFTDPTAINSGQKGLWDFTLTTNGTTENSHYCLRIIKNDSSTLTTYTSVAEIIIPPASINQSSYRWFTNQGVAPDIGANTISTSTSGTATGYSQQRHTWYDGSRYWVAYYNGTQIVFYYSSNGNSWTQNSTATITTSISDFAVEADSSHAYIAYASAGAVQVLDVSNASGYPGTGFSWVAPTAAVTGASGDTISNIAISSDSNGYIWLGWGQYLSGGNSSNANVVQSTNPNAVTAWNASTSLANHITTGTNVFTKLMLCNLGNGNEYVVWFDQIGNALNGKQYTFGSGWVSAASIATSVGNGGSVSLQCNSSSGNAYMLYTTTGGGVKFNQYSGGSWQTALTVDATTTDNHTVLSSDSYNNLYAMWIDTSNNSLNYKKASTPYGSSEWSSSASSIVTTGTNAYLSASSTMSSAGFIGLSWTDGTANPYNVRFYGLSVGGIDVGSPLASQTTAAMLPSSGTAFRLRLNLGVSSSGVAASGQSFKLQYSARSGTCDTSFAGESYADVGTTGTPIIYYDNTGVVDGAFFSANANDPTDGGNALVRQTYEESNNFTNSTSSISVGQDGMWDIALENNSAPSHTRYCLRVVKSNGSLLDTYTDIPELEIPNVSPDAPTLSTPISGATGISISPTFTLSTTDADADYLNYKITIFRSDCATLVARADQTASQAGWSGQDASSSTAYVGSSTLGSSTIATYTFQGALLPNTTYCWQAVAIDPGGTNSWGSNSATQQFTVGQVGTVFKSGIIKSGTIK